LTRFSHSPVSCTFSHTSMLRFIILLVTTACLTQLHTNLSIHKYVSTCEDKDARANYTNTRSTMLQLAPAFGTLAGLMPISVSLLKHSKKRLFLVAGAISTVATAMVPLCERLGFSFHLIARLTQGVGLGMI
ncbi:hypothetical protein PMAYCL1PPCAC_32101, partial [Pristionchus mayeri]